MTLFSTTGQLRRIRDIISGYHRLPFSRSSIPGYVMEGALAQVRNADVLGKYDFVDVIHRADRVGWQVKSTAANTPVTWKRAKISNRNELINASTLSEKGRKELGKAIIDFCNAAISKDFEKHPIDAIGYSRLIAHRDGMATYFERELVTRANPTLFDPDEFQWNWSEQRVGLKKEQLSAFHGMHLPTMKKWWAWHGRGENQLHFPGESTWWPEPQAQHTIRFRLPENRFALDELLNLLDPQAKKTLSPD